MVELGKATILQPGVSVSESDGLRDFGMNAYLIEIGNDRFEDDTFRATDVGEEVSFTGLTVFRKKRSLLTVRGRTNSLEAHVYEAPSATFAPRIVPKEAVYDTTFGEDPNDPAFESFGDPPSVTVEFLGHGDRDWLVPLMQNQEAALIPDLDLTVQSGMKRHVCEGIVHWQHQFTRRLMMTGAVVSTNIYGLHENENVAISASPEHGFAGKLMLGATLYTSSRENEAPTVTIFAATIAESDGLLRVQKELRRELRAEYRGEHTIPSAMYALAELSIYARFQDGSVPANFPLRFLPHFNSYFGAKISDPRPHRAYDGLEEFGEQHEFNWHEIRAGLPKDDVQTEAERLYEFYLQSQIGK